MNKVLLFSILGVFPILLSCSKEDEEPESPISERIVKITEDSITVHSDKFIALYNYFWECPKEFILEDYGVPPSKISKAIVDFGHDKNEGGYMSLRFELLGDDGRSTYLSEVIGIWKFKCFLHKKYGWYEYVDVNDGDLVYALSSGYLEKVGGRSNALTQMKRGKKKEYSDISYK